MGKSIALSALLSMQPACRGWPRRPRAIGGPRAASERSASPWSRPGNARMLRLQAKKLGFRCSSCSSFPVSRRIGVLVWVVWAPVLWNRLNVQWWQGQMSLNSPRRCSWGEEGPEQGLLPRRRAGLNSQLFPCPPARLGASRWGSLRFHFLSVKHKKQHLSLHVQFSRVLTTGAVGQKSFSAHVYTRSRRFPSVEVSAATRPRCRPPRGMLAKRSVKRCRSRSAPCGRWLRSVGTS